MVNTINKETLISDIWKNFFDTVKNNVTSVTINGTGGPNTVTISVVKYSGEDSYLEIEHKEDYPRIIVHSPRLPSEQFTFGRDQINGSIIIEAYATQKEAAAKLISSVMYYLETNRNSFRRYGLYQIQVDTTDEDQYTRGGLNIHVSRAIFRFKNRITRSDA